MRETQVRVAIYLTVYNSMQRTFVRLFVRKDDNKIIQDSLQHALIPPSATSGHFEVTIEDHSEIQLLLQSGPRELPNRVLDE